MALFASVAASAQGLEGPPAHIGQFTLPTSTIYQGIQFGGLSAIDFDARDGSFWAINDDRSQFGPARFHNLTLGCTRSRFSGVTINSQTFMQTPGGGNFPALEVDPEAIRFDQSTGDFFRASEGERTTSLLQNPFVREMNPWGTFVRKLATPSHYNPTFSGASGIRRNLAFESLTLSSNGLMVYAATENALFQDGPEASPTSSTLSRVLGFDEATGAATNEYLYECDAVAVPPIPAGNFATSGLVEMPAISDTEFLTVERSFSNGVGFNVKIFLASIVGATDINGMATAPAGAVTMSKTLAFDLGTL